MDAWLNPFSTDLAMYKGLHREVLTRLSQEGSSLSTHLRFASTCFFLKDYKVCYVMYYSNIKYISIYLKYKSVRRMSYINGINI